MKEKPFEPWPSLPSAVLCADCATSRTHPRKHADEAEGKHHCTTARARMSSSGSTSTEAGRKASRCKPGGSATKIQSNRKEESPTRVRTASAWSAIIAVPKRIASAVRAAKSLRAVKTVTL